MPLKIEMSQVIKIGSLEFTGEEADKLIGSIKLIRINSVDGLSFIQNPTPEIASLLETIRSNEPDQNKLIKQLTEELIAARNILLILGILP